MKCIFICMYICMMYQFHRNQKQTKSPWDFPDVANVSQTCQNARTKQQSLLRLRLTLHRIAFCGDVRKKHLSVLLGTLFSEPIIATERCCFAQLLKVVHSVSDRCFFAPLRKAIRYKRSLKFQRNVNKTFVVF